MGSAQSQQPQLRRNSGSRTSKNSKNSPKHDELQNKFEAIENVKTEIDLFGGNRQSERYSQIQQILTTISKDFQEIKSSASKQKTKNKCDEALIDVQNCIKRLENRVEFNEQALDLAAVESHSFIQSYTPRERPTITIDQNDGIKSLGRIEEDVAKLDHDLRLNIEWKDQSNFKIFEKRIQLLQKDLDLIFVDNSPSLVEKKAEIADQIARCNNQLMKAQQDARKITASPPISKPTDSLGRIEQDAQKLERDIKLCIELDDHNQLKLLKKKIQLLYTDLEMVAVDSHTPLSEKKAAIGKKLIKCNNQIRKSKRNSLQIMENIDKKLEQLGGEALTFDGTKIHEKYNGLKQELESYWTMVYPLDCVGSEERNKKEHLVAKIKNALQELENRAEENRLEAEVLNKLNEEAKKVKDLLEKAATFVRGSGDQAFINIDQELRTIWTAISEMSNVNDTIRRRKEFIITDIQTALKTLQENSQPNSFYEKARVEESQDSLLLNKVKAFEVQWNELNSNLEIHRSIRTDVSKSIVDIFKKVSSDISHKAHILDITEKRKSTGSLVTVKILDSPDQIKKLSNPIEIEIKTQPAVKAIGEMQRIGLKAKSILQQIRDSNCAKHDKEYERFRSELEECRSGLEKIEYNKKSDTIESNKRRALRTVLEAFSVLEQRPTKSSKTCEMMDIYAEIQYFRQQIKTFTGVTKDLNYTKIKQGLSDCLAKLQIVDDDLAMKQDNIRQIQHYHQELETKLAENQAKVKVNKEIADVKRQVSQETKNVIEQVQKLKSQVERFSGVYDGLLYKQIQENLQKCTQKLENIDAKGDDKLESAKIQTKQKIRKYLQVLEARSSKPEVVVSDVKVASVEFEKINALRNKLTDIKTKTENYQGKYRDSGYVKIEEELSRCLDELKVIDDMGHESIVQSKAQYENYIVKLLEYFAEKTKRQNDEIVDPIEELAEIEKMVADLKGKIDGEPSDSPMLREQIESLKEMLENVEVGNVGHVRERKKQLLEELAICGSAVGKILKCREKLDEIWKKIVNTSEEVKQFVGVKNDKNYCRLDEVQIHLMMELEKIDCDENSVLKSLKQQAMQMIQKSMATLEQRVSYGSFSATMV